MILKITWKRRLVITGIFIVILIQRLLFVFSDKLDSKEIKVFWRLRIIKTVRRIGFNNDADYEYDSTYCSIIE